MGKQIHLFFGYKAAYGIKCRTETLQMWALLRRHRTRCVKYETFT